MAQLAVTVTVTVTFFLLTLCHARIPLDPSEKEVVLSDPAPKTYLPSNEQPESKPKLTQFEWELEKTESTESDAASEPLTMISFRPVNHHFRPFPLTSRRGHRCRQHRLEGYIHKIKPLGPRFPNREVPYGNDMIVPNEENSGADPEFRGEAREMWAKPGHVGHRFHHEDDDGERKEHLKKRHHRHHHEHEERAEREGENNQDHEHEHEHESGFMKRVSKFFDLF
jgi:hypothetical protein